MDNQRNAAHYRVKNFHAVSSCGFDHATFEWVVENVSLCLLDTATCVNSPNFICAGSEWNLRLYPNKFQPSSYIISNDQVCEKEHVTVLLFRNEYPKERMEDKRVSYKLCILGLYGETKYAVEEENVDISYGGVSREIVVHRDIVLGEKKSELLPNDTLTIYCEVIATVRLVHGPVRNITNMLKEEKETASNVNALTQDLKQLSSNSKWCDVTLKAGDQEFPAVKAILASRSTVFDAMFQQHTKESISGVVDIPDIEGPVMQQMLHYVYTGEVQPLSMDGAIKLFAAADKYALVDLKKKCSRFLENILSADNICDIAVLADTYDQKTLKESVCNFVVQNASSVFVTDKWKAMLRETPLLASEIMEAVASNFVTKRII